MLSFYNCLAKSVIFMHFVMVYDASAKTNLMEIDICQRRILRGIFKKA